MDNAVQTIHTTALERVDAVYTVKSQVLATLLAVAYLQRMTKNKPPALGR